MAYAHSKNIEVNQIPVIDVAPLHSGTTEAARAVALEIRQAAEEVGFFYIRNHGIPESVIEQAYLAAQCFFSRPREWKDYVKIKDFKLPVSQIKLKLKIKNEIFEIIDRYIKAFH